MKRIGDRKLKTTATKPYARAKKERERIMKKLFCLKTLLYSLIFLRFVWVRLHVRVCVCVYFYSISFRIFFSLHFGAFLKCPNILFRLGFTCTPQTIQPRILLSTIARCHAIIVIAIYFYWYCWLLLPLRHCCCYADFGAFF